MELERWQAFQCRCVYCIPMCNEVMQLFCFDFLCQCTASRKKERNKEWEKVRGTRATVKKWCQNLSPDNKPQKSFKMQHSTHQHFDKDFFFTFFILLAGKFYTQLALKNYFFLLRPFNLQSGTQKGLSLYGTYWNGAREFKLNFTKAMMNWKSCSCQ